MQMTTSTMTICHVACGLYCCKRAMCDSIVLGVRNLVMAAILRKGIALCERHLQDTRGISRLEKRVRGRTADFCINGAHCRNPAKSCMIDDMIIISYDITQNSFCPLRNPVSTFRYASHTDKLNLCP